MCAAEMGHSPHDDIRWPPRVTQARLRRLYVSEAAGLLDEELLDEVGVTLYLRCQAILDIHRAQDEGLVRCPRCQQQGRETWLRREHATRENPQPLLACAVCGWSVTWAEYSGSYRRRQLNPGGAVDYFQAFVDAYPRCQTVRDKMLAVDALIHSFHYSLRADPTLPTRPAAVNLIEGRLTDIVPFLDALSQGALSQGTPATADPERTATLRRWQAELGRWASEYATWSTWLDERPPGSGALDAVEDSHKTDLQEDE